MAKRGNGKKTQDTLEQINATLKETEAAQARLARGLERETSALDASFRAVAEAPTVVAEAREGRRLAKYTAAVKDKNNKAHRVAVDLGGGSVAQASTELINLGVRALSRWSPDSWVGQNSDFLQGAPHFILGLGIYIAEMASRKNLEMPSTRREVISEASKLFGQLGFSNLVRALRVRYGDGKQKDLDMQALGAEKAELERRYRALQQQVGGQGGGAGGGQGGGKPA